MSTNIETFALNLRKYREETVPGLVKGRVIAIAIQAGAWLAEETPVDTGRAKGNWQFSLGTPHEGEVSRRDLTPHGTSENAMVVHETIAGMKAWEMGQFIWFHNGAPYIRYLNDGTEKVRAFAMVPRTVTRLQQWLAAA